MGQTLSHGVYLPAEGERNCYSGLASNWNLLDTAIGDTAGKASATHTHGNISNDGKVGTTANLPLITGTGGAIQAGSFGNSANTFCEGNDSRLSDARTPVAHTHGKADITDLFNSANTWTGDNTYSKTVAIERSTDTGNFLALKNTVAELGSTPASATPVTIAYRDKNNDNLGYMGVFYDTDGSNLFRVYVRNKFTSGAPSTSGTADYAYFGLRLNADKSKEGILRASLRPYDNNTYDLGSSSYQWNNLYAKNYYYNGVAWGLDKANVWTGSNSFKNITLSTNAESVEILHNTWHGYEQYYTRGTSNYPNYDTFLKWNSTRYDNTLGLFKSVGVLTSTTEGATVDDIDETFAYYIYHINAKYVDFMNNVRIVNDGASDILAPITNATTDLGTSTNKWKSLNGINPGALSLPNFSAEFDVSGQIVPPTGENQISINWGRNTFTPSVNGWLSVRIHKATAIEIYRSIRSSYCAASRVESADDICVCSPVVAGVEYTIKIQATQFSPDYDHFRLSPCFGNV